jgi:hypothetical protein
MQVIIFARWQGSLAEALFFLFQEGGRGEGNGQNFGNVKMYDAKFNIKRHIWANEDDLFYHFAL